MSMMLLPVAIILCVGLCILLDLFFGNNGTIRENNRIISDLREQALAELRKMPNEMIEQKLKDPRREMRKLAKIELKRRSDETRNKIYEAWKKLT